MTFVGVGLLLGVFDGMLGIGGGLLLIPLLSVVFGFDQHHAQGTALVMVAVTLLTSFWRYARRGSLHGRISLVFALTVLPFTYLGAHLAVSLPDGVLKDLFSTFVLAIGVYYAQLSLRNPKPRTLAKLGWRSSFALGGGGGIIDGLFSVGGAPFVIPTLTLLFGLSQVVAQGTALAFAGPSVVVSTLTFAREGYVDWAPGIALAIGAVLSVPVGVRSAHRLPERGLRLVFSLLLLSAGLVLWLE